jgi:tetratricopeptide (TPR) repeat protein
VRADLIDSTKKRLLAFSIAFFLSPTSAIAARPVTSLEVDSPQELRTIAFRRNLENRRDTALDFYQKAIERSSKEYGADSSYTGDLCFEMGLLAFSMSKFTTAEACLARAVQINPHSVVARLKLAQLLKLREKNSAARFQIQQSVEKNTASPEARQQLAAYLQETNPAAAAKQSFLVRQLLSGIPIKVIKPKPAPTMSQTASSVGHQPANTASAKPVTNKPPTTPTPEKRQTKESKKAKPKDNHAAPQIAPSKQKRKEEQPARPVKKKEAASKTKTDSDKAAKGRHPADQVTLVKQQPKAALVEEQPKSAPSQENREAAIPPAKQADSQGDHKQAAQAQPSNHKASKKLPRGLVPPPPPIPFQFGMPRVDPAAIQLKTDAKLKKLAKHAQPGSGEKTENGKEAAGEKSPKSNRESSPAAGQESDPDFLIEWASVKKKQGK